MEGNLYGLYMREGQERKCRICGKTFSCHEDYVYRRREYYKDVFFCRYSHMRQFDLAVEARRAKKKTQTAKGTCERASRIPAETEKAIEEAYRAGETASAAASRLRLGYSTVYKRYAKFRRRDGLE